jgi:hypothetical protein
MLDDTNERPLGCFATATIGERRATMHGVPNKPMVPTAPTSPGENPTGPPRRHIGQSLGSERLAAMAPREQKNETSSLRQCMLGFFARGRFYRPSRSIVP